MPAIKLTDDAIELLKSYRWPGNIRQLKNVTEQISIIEKERFITAEILRKYLEGIDNTNLPALAKSSPSDSFASERELLYKILFDMKKDMNELKMLVNNIIAKYPEVVDDQIAHTFSDFDDEIKINNLTTFVKKEDTSKTIFTEKAEEVEEVLSLAEHEKDLIIKALEKNNNKRKLAAQELGISERTLYRKIKEYGINTKK